MNQKGVLSQVQERGVIQISTGIKGQYTKETRILKRILVTTTIDAI